ncbi:MAG: zinc ABC transporter permease [Gemmataceae bacterium]
MPDWTLLVVLALLGAATGLVGTFAFLRRQSLLSDTLAHAALPGICLAYWWTGNKSLAVLLTGALAAGLVGSLWHTLLVQTTRLKTEAALGVVLCTFFAAGIVLLSLLQAHAGASQTGLDRFIYGQVAYLTDEQMLVLGAVSLALIATVVVLYKELKLFCFDPDYGQTLGFSRRFLSLLLSTLLAGAVILSLRSTGVVLTVALLAGPAAAARQWSHRLGLCLLGAAFFGASSCIAGALLSFHIPQAATGPAIVLVLSAVVALSIVCGPARGWLWHFLRSWRFRRRVEYENALADLFRLAEAQPEAAGFSLEGVARWQQSPASRKRRVLRALVQRGFIEPAEPHRWRLTHAGLRVARRIVRGHRLWETYLAQNLHLPADHLHRDAEAMEHVFSAETLEELARGLQYPAHDPHGHAIPPAEQEGQDA